MCVVSMITEDYGKKWDTNPYNPSNPLELINRVSRAEFEELEAELEDLKKVLIAAKLYDEETEQPDCEKDEKVEVIKKVAEALGVDLEDIL